MCYILPIMNQSMRWMAAAVVWAVLLVAGAEPAPGTSRSFQLVYHSDTRGYYRPCG